MIFMKKIIFILSFVLIMTNANAQSEIKAYGAKAKSGQAIHGVVRDSKGPVKAADVYEVSPKNEVVAYTYTDKNGHFSLELVDPADSLFVGDPEYYTAKCLISDNQYDITLKECTPVRNLEMSMLFNRSHRSLLREAGKYPYLYIDGQTIYRDSKAWEGIDPNKDKYSKKEMARLFGVEASQIDQIDVYPKGSDKTMEQLGPAFVERGVIVILTK